MNRWETIWRSLLSAAVLIQTAQGVVTISGDTNNTAPGLPSLSISSSAPTVGADMVMIGNGRTQAGSATYWHVDGLPGPSDDVWTELAPPDIDINAEGYTTGVTREIRWADNETDTINETITYGAGDVRAFTTSFDSGAMPQEGQAVRADSGGAALYFDGSNWVLSGGRDKPPSPTGQT